MPVISPIFQTVSNPLSTAVISGKLPLLQQYSGAAAAYSLRDLAGDSPSVVRVRRSSDNTEQDFTAAQINDGTLLSFVGSGDGLVTTWYDQSGGGNHATQSTASSQPKIVDGGVLVTENGKAAIDFVIGNNNSALEFSELSKPLHVFIVNASAQAEDDDILLSNGIPSSDGIHLGFNDGLYLRDYPQDAKGYLTGLSANEQNLAEAKLIDGDREYWINGSSVGSNSAITDVTYSHISVEGDSAQGMEGTISEIILYPSDQSANRTSIEANINAYYGIY